MNDTCLTGILTETESCYDRYWRDMEFAANLIEQQREMERFVNESIIRASGNKKAINEMVIINEAAFGDKIKGFFTKIKNFFKKIFDKLGASMNGLFMEQKKYIDKYANIITKCKYVASDVGDVKDHFKGLPRILNAVENSDSAILGTNLDKYLNADKVMGGDGAEIAISQMFPYDDGNKLKAIQTLPEKLSIEKIKTNAYKNFTGEDTYWGKITDLNQESNDDNTPNIDLTFRNYFDGSDDVMTFTADEIDKNFQTIINTTYAGPSYLTKLERIVSSVEKKMDDIEKKMQDYHKAQSDKIQQGIKNANSTTPGQTDVKKGQKFDDVWNNTKTYQNKDNDKDPNNGKKLIDGKYYENIDAFKKDTDAQRKYTAESYQYVIENPTAKPSSTTNPSPSQTKVSGSTGQSDIQNANNANSNISNKKFGNTPEVKNSTTSGVTDNNRNDILTKANQLLEIDIWNRETQINADVQISSAIARAIFSSFKLTNKDFWWIIQHHVQWYLSNPGAESNAENKASRGRALNMNAGNEQVKMDDTNNKSSK